MHQGMAALSPRPHWGNPLPSTKLAAEYLYIHSDHLNTPQVVTDQSQQVAWKADYKPFGEAEATVTTLDMPLRFPGQILDSETNLRYNYFRTYEPATGRYTQTDPYGLAGQQFVVYGYVSNNPIDRFDRDGLETCGSDGNEGLVPDNPLGFQFSSCCAGHDACYATCGKSKSECDTAFKKCMQKKCELANYSITHSICMQTAETYWAAVVNDGGEAYKNAQEEACKDGDCSSVEDST